MAFNLLLGIFAMSMPLFAAAGLIYFMSKGKGKAAPTQDELVERKRKKQQEESN